VLTRKLTEIGEERGRGGELYRCRDEQRISLLKSVVVGKKPKALQVGGWRIKNSAREIRGVEVRCLGHVC